MTDDPEALLARLEGALEDHMNVKFEELARKDNITGVLGGQYCHRHRSVLRNLLLCFGVVP